MDESNQDATAQDRVTEQDPTTAQDRTRTDLGIAAGVSDRGLRHDRNEDAMALRRAGADGMVVTVADGVSTSHRPHEASQAAVEVAADILAHAVLDGHDLADATRDAAAKAAGAVTALHRPGDWGLAPACTFVSAVVVGRRITVGWLGDSRAYWLATTPESRPSQCLTVDDTWAGQAVETGAESAQDAYGMGRGGPLWRWLGADADHGPAQVRTLDAPGAGVLLLCTDGLWNYLWSSERLAEAVRDCDAPASAAELLTDFALESGGRDNVTVVVVRVPPAELAAGN